LVEDTICFLLASSNRGLYPPCYLLLPLAWSRRGCYTFTFMTIKIVQGSCLGTLFVGRVCGHYRWSCWEWYGLSISYAAFFHRLQNTVDEIYAGDIKIRSPASILPWSYTCGVIYNNSCWAP
jgi:hypothetical protein